MNSTKCKLRCPFAGRPNVLLRLLDGLPLALAGHPLREADGEAEAAGKIVEQMQRQRDEREARAAALPEEGEEASIQRHEGRGARGRQPAPRQTPRARAWRRARDRREVARLARCRQDEIEVVRRPRARAGSAVSREASVAPGRSTGSSRASTASGASPAGAWRAGSRRRRDGRDSRARCPRCSGASSSRRTRRAGGRRSVGSRRSRPRTWRPPRSTSGGRSGGAGCDSVRPGSRSAGLSSYDPKTATASGWASKTSPRRATRSGGTVTSLSRNSSTSPVAICAPALRARAGPLRSRVPREPEAGLGSQRLEAGRCRRRRPGCLSSGGGRSAATERRQAASLASLRYAGTTTETVSGASALTPRSGSARSGAAAPTDRSAAPRAPSTRSRRRLRAGRARGSSAAMREAPRQQRDPGSRAVVARSTRADVSPQDLAEARRTGRRASAPWAYGSSARTGRASTPATPRCRGRAAAVSTRATEGAPSASPPMSSNDSRPSWISAASSGACCGGTLPRRSRPRRLKRTKPRLSQGGAKARVRRQSRPSVSSRPVRALTSDSGNAAATEARHDSGRAERSSHSGLACVEPWPRRPWPRTRSIIPPRTSVRALLASIPLGDSTMTSAPGGSRSRTRPSASSARA